MANPSLSPRPSMRLVCVLAGLLLCGNAWAGLGSDVASVQADQRIWGASNTSAMLGSATLYTQTLPNGLTLRQYVDATGCVFAVAWSGPVLPDFERLLGSSYPRYSEALRAQRRGISLHDTDLVIESSGMMRAFSGRAYLPQRLPAALVAQDIR